MDVVALRELILAVRGPAMGRSSYSDQSLGYTELIETEGELE